MNFVRGLHHRILQLLESDGPGPGEISALTDSQRVPLVDHVEVPALFQPASCQHVETGIRQQRVRSIGVAHVAAHARDVIIGSGAELNVGSFEPALDIRDRRP